VFIETMDAVTTLDAETSKGKISIVGNAENIESFRNKWLRVCDLSNAANGGIGTNHSPPRATRQPSIDGWGRTQPLKSGWLLKKRDIFSGWRLRYFVVYLDRLEYFIDQNDSIPKATMSLLDVEVQPVKRVTVQSGQEHWGFV
jgi:hypothetical protein